MSRQAYLEIYGQEPPDGARFGCDLSWYQAARGDSLDSTTLHGTWTDLVAWAEYVCIRCSFGAGGDDGAEQAHVQYADIHKYGGTLGGYHFFINSASPASNAQNYLNRSAPLADRFVFDMLDVEVGTTAGAIEETLDRIAQTRQRECILYSGKSIMDNAGQLGRKRPLWVAHYATSRYQAWAPTSNWALWQAPYMPNQYGSAYPTCWQFTSLTNAHGHLDLNITTTPAAFGIGAPPKPEEDMTPDQAGQLNYVYHVLADTDRLLNMSNALMSVAPQVDTLLHHITDANRLLNIATQTNQIYADQNRLMNLTEGSSRLADSQTATQAGVLRTGTAVGTLPAAVTAAVAAAVAALPPGTGNLSPDGLAKVSAAVADAVGKVLESISIDVSPPTPKAT